MMPAQPVAGYQTGTPRITHARWDGICSACGCAIEAGREVIYTPVLTLLARGPRGRISHIEGECGGAYTVVAQWISSSIRVMVPAYTAAEALSEGKRRIKIRPFQVMPTFTVWQGNVQIQVLAGKRGPR